MPVRCEVRAVCSERGAPLRAHLLDDIRDSRTRKGDVCQLYVRNASGPFFGNILAEMSQIIYSLMYFCIALMFAIKSGDFIAYSLYM